MTSTNITYDSLLWWKTVSDTKINKYDAWQTVYEIEELKPFIHGYLLSNVATLNDVAISVKIEIFESIEDAVAKFDAESKTGNIYVHMQLRSQVNGKLHYRLVYGVV